MPEALDLLAKGADFIAEQFGGVQCVIEGFGLIEKAHWNDLGRTETLELGGRRISFSVVVEFPRSLFPASPAQDFLALSGKIVQRTDTGQVFRVVGEVQLDELTVRFPLESRNK